MRHLREPLTLLATGGGCGLVRYAPGTVGTLLGVAIWWLALADLDLLARAAIAAGAFAAGVAATDRVSKRHGLGDEPAIVLDEIVGCWVALVAAPKSLLWVAAGFALFRVADIVKPWPVSWADRSIKGGLGIMLDDMLAGLLAAGILAVAAHAAAGF